MSYTIVNFIDPNDDQPTVAVFNEDRSRISICESIHFAVKSVTARPRLEASVQAILDSDQLDYAAAIREALKGEGRPFEV
jgi:hypothetical protein